MSAKPRVYSGKKAAAQEGGWLQETVQGKNPIPTTEDKNSTKKEERYVPGQGDFSTNVSRNTIREGRGRPGSRGKDLIINPLLTEKG